MNEKFDVYYNTEIGGGDGVCRLVQTKHTPLFMNQSYSWKLKFSFYAFPGDIIPIPKNITRIVTYYRASFPYDTYAVIPDYNPLADFYQPGIESIKLKTSLLVYGDAVRNTVPLYIFKNVTGQDSILFSLTKAHGYQGYAEIPQSPVWVSRVPVNEFSCLNSICIPQPLLSHNLQHPQPQIPNRTMKFLDCVQSCRKPNETAYEYEMPQKDLLQL
jgi:hypothetical protein